MGGRFWRWLRGGPSATDALRALRCSPIAALQADAGAQKAVGTVEAAETFASPMTGTRCVGVRLRCRLIAFQPGPGELIMDHQEILPFFLRDPTGWLRVAPGQGARMLRFPSQSFHPLAEFGEHLRRFESERPTLRRDHPPTTLFYEEILLLPGVRVSVSGVVTRPAEAHPFRPDATLVLSAPVTISCDASTFR